MNPKPKRISDPTFIKTFKAKPCCICWKRPSDASHIRTRGAGGPDLPFNVVPMCRKHHVEWGQRGQITFLRENPRFANQLALLGWHINWATEELTHQKLIAEQPS